MQRPQSSRRHVQLGSLDDLQAEVERIVAADRQGRLRTTGQWSAAQIIEHLAVFMRFSFDGFPFRYPWRLRLPARLLKPFAWKTLVKLALRPGFRNRGAALAVEPGADVELADAVDHLRAQIERVERGEQMHQPSPAEGAISHSQWLYAHLRHAELHLSFIRFD